jgi:hypothetical protein
VGIFGKFVTLIYLAKHCKMYEAFPNFSRTTKCKQLYISEVPTDSRLRTSYTCKYEIYYDPIIGDLTAEARHSIFIIKRNKTFNPQYFRKMQNDKRTGRD